MSFTKIGQAFILTCFITMLFCVGLIKDLVNDRLSQYFMIKNDQDHKVSKEIILDNNIWDGKALKHSFSQVIKISILYSTLFLQ
jgi:hypothetical protein